MAGEWIAYDLALPGKPEVQELIDLTGQPVEVVCYRLLQLWGWAAMNTENGTARMTLGRLSRTCGGDEAFWRAVAAVGWLEVDETAATVAIPEWDRRFSQAAKARLQHRDRAAAQNDRNPGLRRRAGAACAQAQSPPAPKRSRGEERTGEIPPPPPACAGNVTAEEGWAILRERWNRGPGRPWKPAEAPDEAAERLSEPGWLDDALAAIDRLGACKFFRTPVHLPQFCGPKFVRRVNLGRYDELTERRTGHRTSEADRPSAEAAAARATSFTIKVSGCAIVIAPTATTKRGNAAQ
jgi:hypothetical protein